jgi:peroxiredoxin Q/BCP
MKLKVGDKAPEINAPDQNGKKIHLKDFKGKKVVLYFYPKDDTPGCTAEACNLRDHYTELKEKGIEVIGVSCDPIKSHQKFIDKHNLPFTLVADEEKKVVNDYGVWGPKKFMGKTYNGISRTTFIINEQGVIKAIIEKVDTKNHTQQILEIINQ